MNLLGSVAKGVSGAVQTGLFGPVGQGFNPEDTEVEMLLSRISDGSIVEDRHEALGSLRDLLVDNPNAQMAVGSMGFPVLTEVLRDDRDDVEMLQGALEVLLNACGLPVGATPTLDEGGELKKPGREVQAGALNSDIFARDPSNTQLLMSLLDDEPDGVSDFYVRYHTVQLLTALLSSSAYRLQDAILASPLGVVRLMDMMMEREVIRNEALLLLVALTRSNEEVQKIAAFEGAFERLFNIIRDEGALDGGIIVQDCLEFLNNLLRGNSSNQLMFREMGFLQHVPAILQAPPAVSLPMDIGEAFHTHLLPRQKAANLLCALETVMLLITAQKPPGNNLKAPEPNQTQEQNVVANKELLVGSGILQTLLVLSVNEGSVSSSVVRVQALRCISSLVEGDLRNQERLGSSMVKGTEAEIPALQAVLHVQLHADDAVERAAAQGVLRCYCACNPDGQTILSSTMAPLGGPGDGTGDEGPSSFGTDLVKALVGGGTEASSDLLLSCRAAAALGYLLDGNASVKERVLGIPLMVPGNDAAPPELLLPRVMKYLTAALGGGGSNVPPGSEAEQSSHGRPAAAVLLRLLITWLTECPPAVAAFLTPTSHIPAIMDIAKGKLGSGDSCVAGLACVLVGVCLVYCPPLQVGEKRTCDAATLLDVLSNRVGLAVYFSRWEDMRKHPAFVSASAGPRGPQHFTRATAAAATAEDANLDKTLADPSTASGGEHDGLFDHPFTVFVASFQDKAQEFVLTCYARPHQVSGGGGSLISQLSWSGSDTEQLQAARQALEQCDKEMAELRARNTSLAESLLKAPRGSADGSSEAPAASPQEKGGAEAHQPGSISNGHGDAAGGAASPGASQPPAPKGSGEAIAAAEMRASKAEAEARSAKEQLVSLRNTSRQLESELGAEREECEQQKGAAAKLEGDLADLSGAYNTLEAHSYSLESQVKELQLKLKAMDKVAAASAAGGISEEEAAARVEEAVAAAQAEADESMTDLLECLGQEETKVERLREKLEELGEDVDVLLEGIGEDEDEEEDEEGDEAEGDGNDEQ